MQDEHYRALGTIERAMANTMSFMDFSSSRFASYVRDLAGESISVSAACRMLEMYSDYYRKRKNVRGIRFCSLMEQALLQGVSSSYIRGLYPTIDFEQPLQPEYVAAKRFAYKKLAGRIEVIWMLLVTLIMAGLLAFFVLFLHLDFWLIWVLLFLCWGILLVFGHRVLAPYLAQRRILEFVRYLQEDHKNYMLSSGMQKVSLFQLAKENFMLPRFSFQKKENTSRKIRVRRKKKRTE